MATFCEASSGHASPAKISSIASKKISRDKRPMLSLLHFLRLLLFFSREDMVLTAHQSVQGYDLIFPAAQSVLRCV